MIRILLKITIKHALNFLLIVLQFTYEKDLKATSSNTLNFLLIVIQFTMKNS